MADNRPTLTRFAWLSIAAAVATIGLKGAAYVLTGSVGLLSDALESVVNLVAALIALIVLSVAEKEPDEEHAYGHYKAEYFSSGVEGGLILVAAASIVLAAIPRLIHPQHLELVGPGVAVSALASLINFLVARRLLRAGQEHRSITLEADAQHLMADVWTSIGVLAGVGATVATGWTRLDPIVALVVAVNIVWTGTRLIRRSLLGLLDTALPPAERARIDAVLRPYQERDGIEVHAIRTRQAGARNFISMHVLVPGDWSVHKGHRLLEAIEHDLHAALPGTTVFTHLESLDDPASWADTRLDRASASRT
jgi:cation diffusion facilitator family transporter